MQHLLNLVIKVLALTVVLMLLLSMSGYTFGGILLLAVGLALVAYTAGDSFVLPQYGNMVAVGADAVLTVLGLWLLPGLFGLPALSAGTILLATLVIGIVEYFYHRYLNNKLVLGGMGGGMGGGEGAPEEG